MAENRPPRGTKNKTTLILAPVALLDQWKQEIKKFVNGDWRVCVYHGSDKPGYNTLKTCDVVLTSYGTLVQHIPRDDKAKAKKGKGKRKRENSFISDDDSDDFRSKSKNQPGDLLRMQWYRVVLDEAMIIRNKATLSAKACFMLKSTYRWVLSGKSRFAPLREVVS